MVFVGGFLKKGSTLNAAVRRLAAGTRRGGKLSSRGSKPGKKSKGHARGEESGLADRVVPPWLVPATFGMTFATVGFAVAYTVRGPNTSLENGLPRLMKAIRRRRVEARASVPINAADDGEDGSASPRPRIVTITDVDYAPMVAEPAPPSSVSVDNVFSRQMPWTVATSLFDTRGFFDLTINTLLVTGSAMVLLAKGPRGSAPLFSAPRLAAFGAAGGALANTLTIIYAKTSVNAWRERYSILSPGGKGAPSSVHPATDVALQGSDALALTMVGLAAGLSPMSRAAFLPPIIVLSVLSVFQLYKITDPLYLVSMALRDLPFAPTDAEGTDAVERGAPRRAAKMKSIVQTPDDANAMFQQSAGIRANAWLNLTAGATAGIFGVLIASRRGLGRFSTRGIL